MRLTQRPEGRPDLGREQLRLLPRGEVPALVDLLPIDELLEALLAPAPWRAVNLARKYGYGHRDLADLDRVERPSLALRGVPVGARGRRAGVGEPVERDVV